MVAHRTLADSIAAKCSDFAASQRSVLRTAVCGELRFSRTAVRRSADIKVASVTTFTCTYVGAIVACDVATNSEVSVCVVRRARHGDKYCT